MIELLLFVGALVIVGTVRRQSTRIAALEQTTSDLARRLDLARPMPPAADTGSEKTGPELTGPWSVPLGTSPDPTVASRQPPATPPRQHPLAPPPTASVPSSVPSSTPPPRQTVALPAAAAASQEPRPSLEERLGTRWAVWLGGLALGLGGLLLVRYSIEQGYFGPTARVILGLLFAAALIAGGEWFRHGERNLGLTAIPSAHIPGMLTAAGSVTAFGAIFAAHALYGLIGPTAAFVLLGAIGIATVLAAVLHGPMLGALGLVGAYVAPLLVSSAKPSPWPVVVYLAVVAASALTLARLRHWLWLATLAVAGGALWALPYLFNLGAGTDWQLAGNVHVLAQLGLAAWFLAVEPNRGTDDAEARPDPTASAALGVLALLSAAFFAAGRFDLATSVPFALIATAVLVATAWVSAPSVAGAGLAGLVLLVATATWPGVRVPAPSLMPWDEYAHLLRAPDAIASYMSFAALATLAVTAAASLRLWAGPRLKPATTALYALAATLSPLLALIVVYLRVTQFETSISFAGVAALLAVVFASLTSIFERRADADTDGQRLAAGAFAAAGIGAFCLALVMVFARGYLTVALALTALGTAFIATRQNLPLLRHVVSALGVVVLARLAWDPRIMGADVGQMPILNWLLVGYGVPAAAFWASARQLEGHGATRTAQFADAVAVVLAGLLAMFEIRHLTNGGDILSPTSSHMEMGLLAFVSLGMSYALMRLDLGRANTVFRIASMVFGVIAAGTTLLGLGISENPLLTGEPVRGPAVASSLFVAYALPGIMAAVVARSARGIRPIEYVTVMGVLSLALLFAYVSLEVRHLFQGETIDIAKGTSSAEQWAYSFAWLALGVLMLAYGILRQSFVARVASAATVLLAVLKVFLYDLSHVTGIWRPLSFIVLGLVLIGIGLAYQTLLFGKRPASPKALPPAGPDVLT